jgi:Rod binding domain-containing protein
MLNAISDYTPSSAAAGFARPDGLAARQGDFAAVIARARSSPVGDTPEERKKAAREGAQDFVAVTLVQPLLKQLRDSNHAAAPFAPSSAELQFRAMADAQIAQRIVRATNFPIVDAVARNLMRKGGEAPQGVKG